MDCRHELKFLVHDVDLALLDRRIRHIARPDPHQKDEDGYIITSLYFDDFYDRCHRETVNGCDNRRKYRLRIYGHSSGVIKLERKSKIRGMTAKKSMVMSREEGLLLMRGQIPQPDVQRPQIANQILTEMKMSGMRPSALSNINGAPMYIRWEMYGSPLIGISAQPNKRKPCLTRIYAQRRFLVRGCIFWKLNMIICCRATYTTPWTLEICNKLRFLNTDTQEIH